MRRAEPSRPSCARVVRRRHQRRQHRSERERERSNSSDCETCPRGCRGCTLRLEPAHSLRFTGRRRRLQRKPRGVASSQEEPAAAERKREEENEKEIVHLKARDAQTTTVARRSSKQEAEMIEILNSNYEPNNHTSPTLHCGPQNADKQTIIMNYICMYPVPSNIYCLYLLK